MFTCRHENDEKPTDGRIGMKKIYKNKTTSLKKFGIFGFHICIRVSTVIVKLIRSFRVNFLTISNRGKRDQ